MERELPALLGMEGACPCELGGCDSGDDVPCDCEEGV